jgi:transposase InsO family protein
MKQWRFDFPVEVMARVLEVSRSGFYAWQERPPSARALEDERLKVAISAVHVKTRETYGAKRLQTELKADGVEVGRDRIARLRRELGIFCKQKRKFKATTQSQHDLPVAENLLGQCFQAAAPNEVWHTDITYIPTGEGWLYLAGVKDQFTCEIVGYTLGSRMTQELVGQALWRAIRYQRPAPGLIHHSDRGSQYCALDYQRLLEHHGLLASMSGKGNCYDNAPMESFWGSLKNELVHHRRYETRAEAEASIRGYIEIFYNRQRRHSRLGNLAPAVFAQNFRNTQKAA